MSKRNISLGMILVLVLMMSLCACENYHGNKDGTDSSSVETFSTEQDTETAEDYTTETEAETISETVTEAVFDNTDTSADREGHSQLYIPDCSTQQMIDYFEEVVLNTEFTEGTGDASLVQKWDTPIYYKIYGSPTERDLEVLNGLFVQLNEVHGFPGIYEADGIAENLTINFMDADGFSDEFSEFFGGEGSLGGARFWYFEDTNDIYSGLVGYRTDLTQEERDSIILEEIVNVLGISDTVLREDSIVYQYSDYNTALSNVDWAILKLLYNPVIRCGFDYDNCCESIRELYY